MFSGRWVFARLPHLVEIRVLFLSKNQTATCQSPVGCLRSLILKERLAVVAPHQCPIRERNSSRWHFVYRRKFERIMTGGLLPHHNIGTARKELDMALITAGKAVQLRMVLTRRRGSKRYGLSDVSEDGNDSVTESHISTTRGAYSDLTRTIFLAKYVINDEILLDQKCPSYISWCSLSNLTVRLTLSALGWLSYRL